MRKKLFVSLFFVLFQFQAEAGVIDWLVYKPLSVVGYMIGFVNPFFSKEYLERAQQETNQFAKDKAATLQKESNEQMTSIGKQVLTIFENAKKINTDADSIKSSMQDNHGNVMSQITELNEAGNEQNKKQEEQLQQQNHEISKLKRYSEQHYLMQNKFRLKLGYRLGNERRKTNNHFKNHMNYLKLYNLKLNEFKSFQNQALDCQDAQTARIINLIINLDENDNQIGILRKQMKQALEQLDKQRSEEIKTVDGIVDDIILAVENSRKLAVKLVPRINDAHKRIDLLEKKQNAHEIKSTPERQDLFSDNAMLGKNFLNRSNQMMCLGTTNNV